MLPHIEGCSGNRPWSAARAARASRGWGPSCGASMPATWPMASGAWSGVPPQTGGAFTSGWKEGSRPELLARVGGCPGSGHSPVAVLTGNQVLVGTREAEPHAPSSSHVSAMACSSVTGLAVIGPCRPAQGGPSPSPRRRAQARHHGADHAAQHGAGDRANLPHLPGILRLHLVIELVLPRAQLTKRARRLPKPLCQFGILPQRAKLARERALIPRRRRRWTPGLEEIATDPLVRPKGIGHRAGLHRPAKTPGPEPVIPDEARPPARGRGHQLLVHRRLRLEQLLTTGELSVRHVGPGFGRPLAILLDGLDARRARLVPRPELGLELRPQLRL